jgi:hypothetical protein
LRNAPAAFSYSPTAQQLLAVPQTAPKSRFFEPKDVPPGFGVTAFVHLFPFQCRISFRYFWVGSLDP